MVVVLIQTFGPVPRRPWTLTAYETADRYDFEFVVRNPSVVTYRGPLASSQASKSVASPASIVASPFPRV